MGTGRLVAGEGRPIMGKRTSRNGTKDDEKRTSNIWKKDGESILKSRKSDQTVTILDGSNKYVHHEW